MIGSRASGPVSFAILADSSDISLTTPLLRGKRSRASRPLANLAVSTLTLLPADGIASASRSVTLTFV